MGQSPGDPGPKIGVTKDAGLPWAHSESINISKSQTPMFNLLDYLYFHLASVEITDPWGNTVALHGGKASLYWVRQLLLIPLGMTCDIDFVSEASLSCRTAEVVLNIYHILTMYIYINGSS